MARVTDCNRCGECCDPVVLAFTKAELRRMNAGEGITEEDRAFVLEHMHQLPAREGLHRAAHYNGRFDNVGRENTVTGGVEVRGDRSTFYRCDFFDDDPTSPTYRQCTAHEQRPPLCRGFPYYGRPPGESGKFLPLDCSYRIDLIEKPK